MLDKPAEPTRASEPVVIKKYANRRLYNTETSTYVTLEDLAKMVRSDRDFVVYDAKSGDDLTHSVLTQIIVEQESKSNGPNLFSTPFLRQLIRFNDDMGISHMVPSYLQLSMEALAREQERLRANFAQAWGTNSFEVYNEQIRKNLAMFEQAMKMWTPPASGYGADRGHGPTPNGAAASGPQFNSANGPSNAEAPEGPASRSESKELTELRSQLEDMQRKIELLARQPK